MNKVGVLLLISTLIVYACKQNGNYANTNSKAGKDTVKFFQVTQYLQQQIEEVNKTPYYIYKTTVANGKADSSAINTAVFNQLSATFLKPDINNPDFKKNYTESVFHDQTTKSFTLSYSTNNKNLEVQNIQVLLQEDGQTVRRIFIRKFFNYTDSSAIEQLSWKPGQSFQIYRLVQKNDKKENAYQTNVVWNEKS